MEVRSGGFPIVLCLRRQRFIAIGLRRLDAGIVEMHDWCYLEQNKLPGWFVVESSLTGL